jgi:cytochrome c biogenesis factor
MDEKMKSCFTPHVLMHSLFGLGLGILAVAVIPGLRSIWLGLILMAIAVVLDMTRKS